MSTPLTFIETVVIGSQNSSTPYKASSLLKNFGTPGKTMSFCAVRDKIQSRKNIFIVQIRNSVIVQDSATLADFQSNWASLNPAFVPTQTGLQNFVKTVQASGISVLKISKDWRTVALGGTTQSFASLTMAYMAPPKTASSSVSTQSSGGLKLQGGPTLGPGGGAVVVGVGAVPTGAGLAGTGIVGVGTAGSATGLGAGAGTLGAGAAGEASLAGGAGLVTGGTAWVVLGIGLLIMGIGAYLMGDGNSSSQTTPTPSPATSSNDAPQGNEANDGTEVFGSDSSSDATAIANALNGLTPADASSVGSSPSSSPICPGSICPSVPICATPVAVATTSGGGNSPGCPVTGSPFGTCPNTGEPITLGQIEGEGGFGCAGGEEEG